MKKKLDLLNRLVVNDLFYARFSTTSGQIFIVTDVHAESIRARSVTTQLVGLFDKETCKSVGKIRGRSYVIVSISPVTPDVYGVLLGMDRKFRIEVRSGMHRLSEDEKRVLLLIEDFYSNNSLDSYLLSDR